MGASGSVASKNRIQKSDQVQASPRVTGKITNQESKTEQHQAIHDVQHEVTIALQQKETKTSSFRRLNIKSYEKHDEEVLNEWSNVLHRNHKANIVPGDDLNYSPNDLEPFVLFSDLSRSVDDQALLGNARVRGYQVVLITVKGYSSPIAGCLKMEKYCDGSNTNTTIVFSPLQTLSFIDQNDKKLAEIVKNSIIPSISVRDMKVPPKKITDMAIPILSIASVREFDEIMYATEECLVKIDSNEDFSTDNISTYMWTSLGLPLLHYAVSIDNVNAVKKLLSHGACVENKDCFGRNALFYAKSQTTAKVLMDHLTEMEMLDELLCVDTSTQLVSHVIVSNYSQNPGLTKALLLELTKETPKQTCISLFNSLDDNSKTAIDILNYQVYTYAKKFKNSSHHTLMNFLFEEIRWQIENKVNFHQLLQTKISSGGTLSFFAEAACEENIVLLHYLLENRIIDNEVDISEYLTSIHIAKMVSQMVPEIFDRYIPENNEKTSSALSRVILNMRSGNIPLINFIIEQYKYELLPHEINQVIELAVNRRTQSKVLPTLEKCINASNGSKLLVQTKTRGELFSKLKKANTIFICSPFEMILSLDRKVSESIGKIEKLMWEKIKSVSSIDENAKSLLLNSCGFIISEIIKNKKFDLIEDVVSYLYKVGLSENHLDSTLNHHKWKQEDIIYNSISTIYHSKEDISRSLTIPLLKSLISVTRNQPDLQTHILILGLYLKKAEIAILKKLLLDRLSFTSFGSAFEITEELKTQLFDFDYLKLKKYIQSCSHPITIDTAVCESTYVEMVLDQSRKLELYPLLVTDGCNALKEQHVFMEKCDLKFFQEMADCVEEEFWYEFVDTFTELVLERKFEHTSKLDYLLRKDRHVMGLYIIKEYLGQQVSSESYEALVEVGAVDIRFFSVWKKCYTKNKNMSWNAVYILLKHNPYYMVANLYRLELLDKVLDKLKSLDSTFLMTCTEFLFTVSPNTEAKKQQYEKVTDVIIDSLAENSFIELLVKAILKSNCLVLTKVIAKIEQKRVIINWEEEGITQAILYSLRSGCDTLIPTLLNSNSLNLERLLMLKGQTGMSEQPMHAICFGGCTQSLKYIYDTLPRSEFVPHFFNVIELYSNSQTTSVEDDDDGCDVELPYRELSVPTCSILRADLKMNNLVFEIIRDIAMTTPIPFSVFGNWECDQNIFQRIITSKSQFHYSGAIDLNVLSKSLWMQHLVDNEELYRKLIEEHGENAIQFVRLIVVHLIFGHTLTDAIELDKPHPCRGIPQDKKLWVDFFRCYFRLKCFVDGDFEVFLNGFKNGLTEEEILYTMQDYFYELEKSKATTEFMNIMKYNNGSGDEVPRSFFLVSIIIKEWERLVSYILDLVNENEDIEREFWTMREDLEISAKYLNPKYENKCIQLLFGKCKFLGNEIRDLVCCENNTRIITTSDEIRIAELRGKVLRDKTWSYRIAERDVGRYVCQKVKFEPPLSKFSLEKAKILTSVSVFGDVATKMIEDAEEIEEIVVVVCNSAENLKSTIEKPKLILRVYLDKDYVVVGELEGKKVTDTGHF